jgi:hypothetical protein
MARGPWQGRSNGKIRCFGILPRDVSTEAPMEITPLKDIDRNKKIALFAPIE